MFVRAALTFLYISFVVVLHLKLPSWTFSEENFAGVSVRFFVLLAFIVVDVWHFSFPHRRFTFFMFSSKEMILRCLLSLALPLSLLSTSMKTLKSRRKKDSTLLLFYSLKVRVAMRFTAKRRGCLKCKILPRLTWKGVRTYRRFCQNQNLTTFWYVWTTTSSPFFCMLQPVNNCLQ